VHPGAVVLAHDGGGDRGQTVAALRACLPRLLDRGYALVRPDMF
jgi:peptidoglycan/xylan/chitin deacetylase (PgdA/CDA1 family)